MGCLSSQQATGNTLSYKNDPENKQLQKTGANPEANDPYTNPNRASKQIPQRQKDRSSVQRHQNEQKQKSPYVSNVAGQSVIHKMSQEHKLQPNKQNSFIQKLIQAGRQNQYDKIDPKDIAVETTNNLMAQRQPKSTVINVQYMDYPNKAAGKQDEPAAQDPLNGRQISYLTGVNEEEDVVHSQGHARFTPTVRNINFHVQIT